MPRPRMPGTRGRWEDDAKDAKSAKRRRKRHPPITTPVFLLPAPRFVLSSYFVLTHAVSCCFIALFVLVHVLVIVLVPFSRSTRFSVRVYWSKSSWTAVKIALPGIPKRRTKEEKEGREREGKKERLNSQLHQQSHTSPTT